MDSFGFGIFSLQSGIVVAVLIAAVLLAERLGDYEELARKATQVSLGVVITLTVLAGTAATIRLPDPPEGAGIFDSSSSGSQEDQEATEEFFRDSAKRASEAGTIHIGAGIALVAIAAAALRRLKTIPAALLLGGILLLLLGASPGRGTDSNALSLIYAPLLGYATDPGQAHDAARFIVLLIGTVLLLAFIAWRWEPPPSTRSGLTPDAPPSA